MHNEEREASWPTPEAYVVRGPIPTEFVDGKFVSLHGEVKYGAKIADAVRVMETWATPRAGCPGSQAPGTGGKVLEEQVKGGNWATPRSRDAGDWMMNKERLAAGMPEDILTGQATQSNKSNGGKVLEEQVKVGDSWATPQSRDAKGAEGRMIREGKLADLPSQTEVAPTGQWNRANGKLNPRWVSVLMNLPVFWTRP
jgi:hypothetical protein